MKKAKTKVRQVAKTATVLVSRAKAMALNVDMEAAGRNFSRCPTALSANFTRGRVKRTTARRMAEAMTKAAGRVITVEDFSMRRKAQIVPVTPGK